MMVFISAGLNPSKAWQKLHHRQVFGLMGERLITQPDSYSPPLPSQFRPVLNGSFRSQLPLRVSPGFAPGSLFRTATFSHRGPTDNESVFSKESRFASIDFAQ
jgi:hypothetical protein